MVEPSVQKSQLREMMKIRRAAVSPEDHQSASASVRLQLLQLLCQGPVSPLDGALGALRSKPSMIISGYIPLPGEIPLKPLDFPAHWRWVWPRISGKNLEFVASKDAELGSAHPLEPLAGESVDLARVAVVLVPLLAFDSQLQRVGFGGGYFDRALAEYQGLKVGIGYSFQRVAVRIARDPWDVPLDVVITEKWTSLSVDRLRRFGQPTSSVGGADFQNDIQKG